MSEYDGMAGRPTVVVGVDGSELSRQVLAHALVAAARRGADLDVVASVAVELYYLGGAPLAMPDLGDIRGEAHDRMRALVDEVLADPGVSCVPGAQQVAVTIVVTERPPAPELVDRSADAVLLVVGSRGRGAARSALLGSVALHCATHAACPVVVVHPRGTTDGRPARVVVGIDGSAGSLEALVAAIEEAARLGASVAVVSTYESAQDRTDLGSLLGPTVEDVRTRVGQVAREQLDTALTEVGQPGVASVPDVGIEIVEGSPVDVLTDRSRDADLLVVGCRGRGAFRALLLGSIALNCVIKASCPVMVVHPAGERAADPSLQAPAMP